MTTHDILLPWLWLATRAGLGAVNIARLRERWPEPAVLLSADEAFLDREGLRGRVRTALLDKSLDRPKAILDRCEALGVTILCPQSPEYPRRLLQLADPPPVLYCRGRLPKLQTLPVIGVVGSRKSDSRGDETARILAYQISGCGGVVATGLARGVDTQAALGALEAGGPVLGVLGCGVDVVYPRENAALFDAVAAHGCLLSEYPPGAAPNAGHFPVRNRIISGLADGILVVQAAEHSGALITARHALDQGKDVFAVPGQPGDPLAVGCNLLIREGAVLVGAGWDLMAEYEYRYPAAVREFHGRPAPEEALPAAAQAGTAQAQTAPGTLQAKAAPEAAQAGALPPLPADLSPLQRKIAELLTGGPMQLDELIAAAACPAARVLTELTLLQIRGVVAQGPGRLYLLCAKPQG